MKKIVLIIVLGGSLLLDAGKSETVITIANETSYSLKIYYWLFNDDKQERESYCIKMKPSGKCWLDAHRFMHNLGIFVKAFNRNDFVAELGKEIPKNTQQIIIEPKELLPQISMEDQY